MYVLLASVTCSVAVSILLKLAKRLNIHIGQAIAVNYVVAAGLCLALLQPQANSLLSPGLHWWVLGALGLLLPTVFIAMAGSVRHAGIVLSDAAQRLSLFIPLIAAFLLFNEVFSGRKLASICFAIIALACLLWRKKTQTNTAKNSIGIILLLCVWLGYGAIDVLFKQLAQSGAVLANSLLSAFTLAAIFMGVYLFIQRSQWHLHNALAGLVLGLLNFGNIYFYIRAHQLFPNDPTLIFSAMNIGVISLGTLAGAGLFKEKISWPNALGIILAIGAIVGLIP